MSIKIDKKTENIYIDGKIHENNLHIDNVTSTNKGNHKCSEDLTILISELLLEHPNILSISFLVSTEDPNDTIPAIICYTKACKNNDYKIIKYTNRFNNFKLIMTDEINLNSDDGKRSLLSEISPLELGKSKSLNNSRIYAVKNIEDMKGGINKKKSNKQKKTRKSKKKSKKSIKRRRHTKRR